MGSSYEAIIDVSSGCPWLDPAIDGCRDGEDSSALLQGSDRWSMYEVIEGPIVGFIVW